MRLHVGFAFAVAVAVASALAVADAVRAAEPPQPDAGSTFENALRLARELHDERVVAELLSGRALAPDASARELDEIVEALEAIGDPSRAAALLEARVQAFPSEDATRKKLAALLARSGRAGDAARVWAGLAARAVPLTARETDEYARILDGAGARDEAYRALAAARDTADPDEHDYWSDLAELAWQRGDAPAALVAYRRLWAVGDRRHVVAERLVTLAADVGALAEATSVALADFRANHAVGPLLKITRVALDHDDWARAASMLAIVKAGGARLEADAQYSIFRAEVRAHFGDLRGARASYLAALAIDPGSVEAKSALIADALDRGDLERVRTLVDRWHVDAAVEPDLWQIYAEALERLGRSREALALAARARRSAPNGDLPVLLFADALDEAGETALSARMRRRAALRSGRLLAALRASSPDDEDRRLGEEAVALASDVAGPARAERWLRALRAARRPRDRGTDAFVTQWCIARERFECAGRLLPRKDPLNAHGLGADASARFQLALAQRDEGTLSDLLQAPSRLGPVERAEAADALERDHLLLAVEMQGGAAYERVGPLEAYGPDAGAAHELGGLHLSYSLGARRLDVAQGGLGIADGGVYAVEGFGMGRWSSHGTAMEAGAGASWQGETTVPRASFQLERAFPWVAAIGRVASGERIEDTALLRLAARQSIAEVIARADLGRAFYAQTDLHARVDASRRFEWIGRELGETAEGGLKLRRAAPEWDLGVQALAQQRDNVAILPADVRSSLPPTVGRSFTELPPSYQVVSLVTHLTRGDFFERHRVEGTSFPQYDCTAQVGVLFPDRQAAVEAQCVVSVRAWRSGYISASGLIDRGILGIATQTNALASLSFMQIL